MGYVSKEYLKENGYILFKYQKSDDGSEGVLPVNIDDLPEVDGPRECDKLCKYCDKEEGCLFWFMGSGLPNDMPCARG